MLRVRDVSLLPWPRGTVQTASHVPSDVALIQIAHLPPQERKRCIDRLVCRWMRPETAAVWVLVQRINEIAFAAASVLFLVYLLTLPSIRTHLLRLATWRRSSAAQKAELDCRHNNNRGYQLSLLSQVTRLEPHDWHTWAWYDGLSSEPGVICHVEGSCCCVGP